MTRDENTEVQFDVQKIMEEIRAEIREKHVLDDIPSFDDIPIRETPTASQEANYREHFIENLGYLNRNYELPYYWELGSSKIKKFMQRVIRKLVGFLLYPITQRQTEFNAQTVRCLNAVRDNMSVQDQTNQRLQNELDNLKATVEELIRQTSSMSLKSTDDVYSAIDYISFQNAFRGSRQVIKDRQSIYLKYFTSNDIPVLDIGCGRGEFLQLMKEHNISAFGIDLCPEYVIEGTLYGLDVREGDGIEFLQNTDMQFNGIMAAQVIEHLSFEQLQVLCKNAYDKLLPGKYLILETPNPMSLSIFTTTFYVDPSHQKPIHPLLIEYILKEIGFSEVLFEFTDMSKPEQLPVVESDAIRNIDAVNAGIQRVSNMLFGSLDYAVIARK